MTRANPPVRIGLAVVLGLVLSGCNRSIYPVEGQVVDMDGKPITELKGCSVEFDSLEAKKSATGTIDEHGKFCMTTERDGDGAWLGRHRVLISRPEWETDSRPKPRVILEKYETFEKSKLEATVEARSNSIELKVERVKKPTTK